MAKKAKRARGLKPAHQVFALLYLANGNNGRQAYNDAYPRKRADNTTDVNASRLLRTAKVQAFIEARMAKLTAAAEATAEEAMAVITRTLRVDPRALLDAKGKPIPMQDWPDDLALVVKSVKVNGDVVFYDKMHAAELIAESHGRIKKKLDISLAFDHVRYLADKSKPK